MTRRVLLLGATGYTGALTAAALLRRGVSPVLVGRHPGRLARLVDGLPAARVRPETLVLDATDVAALRRTVTGDDVVISTVGPFRDLGRPVAEAAAESGATYLDSTGEASFVRWVFDVARPRAARRGARLLTAFGYDYVPGNLAGATALARAGSVAQPARLEIGYFLDGGSGRSLSAGTVASAARAALDPGHTYRRGLRPERVGARTARFAVDGRWRRGLSVGGTEQLTLPELAPSLERIEVFLGWLGPATRAVSLLSPAGPLLRRVPGARPLLATLGDAVASAGGGEPDPGAVADGRATVVARVLAADGRTLAEVTLGGPSPYPLTAELLAWGAATAARDGLDVEPGAPGPVQAFGLDGLTAGCAEVGLLER